MTVLPSLQGCYRKGLVVMREMKNGRVAAAKGVRCSLWRARSARRVRVVYR